MVGILTRRPQVEAISKEELFRRLDERIASVNTELERVKSLDVPNEKKEKEKKEINIKKSVTEFKDNTKNKAENFVHNAKLNKYGLSTSDDFSADINDEGKISHCLKTYGIEYPAVIKDDLDEYFIQLVKGDFKENSDFTEKDGEIYNVAKTLFNAAYGTPDGEKDLLTISRFMNIHARQIGGVEWKDEKIGAKTIRKSFDNNEAIKSGIGKFAKEENWLKNAAWIATHAYACNQFIGEKYISYLIPKDDRIVEAWNKYLEGFSDIPTSVKAYFNLEKGGKCPFLNDYNLKCKLNESESPKDDQVFDESADVKGGEITFSPTIESAARELDNQYKEAISIDDARDERKFNSTVVTQAEIQAEIDRDRAFEAAAASAIEKPEFTFGDLHNVKKGPTKANVVNPAEIAKQQMETTQDAAKAAVRINPTTGMPEAVEFDEYFINNSQWHACVNKLDAFTKIAHDCGMTVCYEADRMFPGMILANLFQRGASMIYNQVRIDPYIVYGDCLRVVTMENNENDLRKETFIPVTQTATITKLLKKEFTKEDRQKVNETLPRVFSDFSEKYHILDRIDFRGLSNGKGIAAKDYKKTVENISNILKDKSVPLCRFRISDYVDPNNFKLVCDSYVLSAFKTGIVNEQSNVESFMKGVTINYNPATSNNKRGFTIS